MSNEMDSSLETLGELFFFRKNEENKGTRYPLYAGETTIGSSENADVRLKLNDNRLKAIHCIFDVEENGRVTVTNKSETAPITVNNVAVKKMKVLKHNDLLEILGKKFQYFNEKKFEMKAASHSKLSNITTVNRHSVSHPVHMKSPKVKTKTSMNVQKKPIRRKSTESSSADFIEKKTPTRPVMKKASTAEKSKTTSKLIGSKVSSNIPTKIRRLSLGNQSWKKQTPNISCRNITLKSKIISSVIKESEDIKQKNKSQSFKTNLTPQKQQIKSHTPKKENPLIRPNFKNSTRKSLKLEPKAISEIKQQYTLDLINFSPPRKSIIKTSFRRSSAKLDPEEVSKMVTFHKSSEKKSKQRVSLFTESRKTINSDETEKLILSSNSSFASPLECTTESDDDIFDSDIYADTKSFNLSKSAARNSESLSKLSEIVSPSKILRSSRRMSKDNPKYYSEELVTSPRIKSLQAVTPKQKSNLSLRTSTPMVVKNVSIENSSRRSSGAKKSLNMSGSVLNESHNAGTEMNDITNLTPEEHQSKPSLTDVEDILARISPIKTSIHKNNSKRLSKSVLENSLSQLSNAEVSAQNSLTNFRRTSKARLSKANVSLTISNVERKSGRSSTKKESFTESSQQPETNEVSFLNNRNSTHFRQSTRLSLTGNSKPANIYFEEGNDQTSQLMTDAPSSTRHSVRLSTSKNNDVSTDDALSQTPEQGLNVSSKRQSVRLSGVAPKIDRLVESEDVPVNSSNLYNEVSNTSRNSAVLSESMLKTRRLSKKSFSNVSSINVLNNSSKMNDSKVELQSELSRSHVENSPATIGQRSLSSSSMRHSMKLSTRMNDEILTGDGAQTPEKGVNISHNRQSARLSGMAPKIVRSVEPEDLHANLSELNNGEVGNTSRNSSILSESMSKSRRLSKKSISNVSCTNVLNNSAKMNDSKLELHSELSCSHVENSAATIGQRSERSLNSSGMRHSMRLSTSKNDEILTVDGAQTPEKGLHTSHNRQSARLSGMTPKIDRSVESADLHANLSQLDNEVVRNTSRNSTILSESMSKSRRLSKKSISNVSRTNVLNNSSKMNDSKVELQSELSRSHVENSPATIGQRSLNSSSMRHSMRLDTSKNDEILTVESDCFQTPEKGLNTSRNRQSVRLSGLHFTNGMTPKIDRSVESEDLHVNLSKLDNEEVSNTSRNSTILSESMSKSRRLSKKGLSNVSSINVLNNSSKMNDSKVELQSELSRSHVENSPVTIGQRSLNSSSMRHSMRLSTSINDEIFTGDGAQTPEKGLNISHNRQSARLNGMTSELNNEEVRNTSRNSTILSETMSTSGRLSKKSISNVSRTNVLNNSSNINDSKVELQIDLSRSHVENSPAAIGNISKQRRSRSSIKALDSSDLENDQKVNSELLIEITDSSSVQANESVRSVRKSKRSQSLVELISKTTETDEGNLSFSIDKSGRKSELVPDMDVNSVRKSTRISRNSLEKSFPKAKGRIAMLKAERSKSLDKGINDIHSQKTLRRRAGKSLGVNLLQNVSSDSDKIVLAREKRNKLSVPKNMESIQNSSYKESFGDSFISSKTSTPRRLSSRTTKITQFEVSEHLNKDESTVSNIEIVDEVITLHSSEYEDSVTEKERALLATPTPIKYSRTEGRSRISLRNSSQIMSGNSSTSSEFPDLFTMSDSITMSEKASTSLVSKTRNSSFSSNALVMPIKTPTPRKSAKLQNEHESPYTPTCTPKNNVSIVDVDTPFETSAKSPKLSKTLNSVITDESELTTPKTALKGTRAKSLPYKPITEDISPASPIKSSRDDSGFKTPFNTPGLFENIRESVIKSRSRLMRTTSTLDDTLGEKSSEARAPKRPRESTGESARLNKRRKIGRNVQELDFQFSSGSFSSFHSDDVIPELSKLDTTATPPAHFENLTDKPFVVQPETKKQRRSQKNKLQKSPKNDLSDVAGLKQLLKTPRVRKGPKNDLSNVAGVKKLLSTPKPISSPKNDLTNVPGVKKLFSDEVKMKSPKNDLTNVAGVKKLLSTPKHVKSPQNDLTKVVGIRKLMRTPKNVKSPKNDLTNVAGVKKLLSTPKELRSPKNDLTNVAGVKKLMSTPKELKSPKNDLTNVAGVKKLLKTPQKVNSPRNDLSDVTGVRRLMSTPKEVKSPRNDLSKIASIRNLMSTPKVKNSPKNDLSNVEGLVSLFAEHRNSNISDQENNDLFARIFDKKPLKTYRGKSTSPFKREDIQSSGRKTLGDVPITSPRVENWVQEQVKLKQEQLANALDSSKKHRKTKQIETEVSNDSNDVPVEIESDIPNLEEIIPPAKVTTKSTRGRKNFTEVSSISEELENKEVDTNEHSKNIDIVKDPIEKSDTQVRGRGRRKKVDGTPVKIQNSIDSSTTKHTDTPTEQIEKSDTPLKGRGRRKKVDGSPIKVQKSIAPKTTKQIETPSEQIEKLDTPIKGRGRRKKADETPSEQFEEMDDAPVKGRGRRRKADQSPIKIQNLVDSSMTKQTETPSEQIEKLDTPLKGRGRRRKVDESPIKIQNLVDSRTTKQIETPIEQIEKLGTPVKGRGRRKKVDETPSEQIEESDAPVKGRGRRKKVDESPEKTQSVIDSSTTKEIETPSEKIEEDAPVKGRGRRKKVVESPIKIEPAEVKRGRPAKKGNKEVTESTKEVENPENQKKEKITPVSKEFDNESQEEVKLVRRGRTRIIESAEQHETTNSTPQKTTRGKKKGNVAEVVEDVQNNNDEGNITSQPITIQKKTRGKKQTEDSCNQETKQLDIAEVEVSTRRGRRNLKDNNETENVTEKETDKPEAKSRGGSRKNKDQEKKVIPEDEVESSESAENNIELPSKPRGRGRKQVEIIEEGSPKNTEQKSGRTTRKAVKNDEVIMQEVSSVATKRTRKAQIEDSVKETETVSSPLPVAKASRNRRYAKTEENTEDSSEMKRDTKTVVFAEPIVQSPIKGRRRNVQSDLPEEPVEVRSKRTRKGKNDVEVSKEKETIETPPAKRTRRGTAKENPEMVTEKVEKRTRRK